MGRIRLGVALAGVTAGLIALAPGTATAATAPPSPTKDPKCRRLHKKLKHQKRNLANAGTSKKQSMIRVNIADTKKRLKRLGC